MTVPAGAVSAKAQLFRSLGGPGRLEVLELLERRPHRVGELVRASGRPQSTVSTHLAALHAAGLVARQAQGRRVWYGPALPAVATVLAAAEEVVRGAAAGGDRCARPRCAPSPDGRR